MLQIDNWIYSLTYLSTHEIGYTVNSTRYHRDRSTPINCTWRYLPDSIAAEYDVLGQLLAKS